MDEKVKHRLVGLAVVIAMTAIFAPVLVKQSNQKWNETSSAHFDMPPPPEQPKVVVSTEHEMFRSGKVASVSLDDSVNSEKVPAISVKQPRPVAAATEKVVTPDTSKQAKVASKKVTTTKTAASTRVNTAVKAKPRQLTSALLPPAELAMVTKPSVPKVTAVNSTRKSSPSRIGRVYEIQLASFSKQQNAKKMVERLHKKGFQAHWETSKNRKGRVISKVVVGHEESLKNANALLAKLKKSVKLEGIIVRA